MLDHPEPQLMTRIAELISPVGRLRRAAQLNCPVELLTKELPLVVKRTVSACRLPASELGYVCTLQDSTVHGMREVISMPSACHQHAISMPSACHQHAISMQSERSHLHDSTRLPQAVLMLDSYMHPGAAIIRGALPTALSSGTTYIESMQPTGGIQSLG
jgi:hypothetical protein